VALLRDRPEAAKADPSLEVLLLTRPASSVFAPGAEVFPGGSVDPADLDPEWLGLRAAWVPSAEVEWHLIVTAVRETFEECGVLLACDANGRPIPPQRVAALAPLRRELQEGHPDRLLPGLREADLRPAWGELAFCAHWVTPEGLPRIFDTRFFLAALPAGQEPSRDQPGELDSMRWVDPATALVEAVQGRTLLLPPTRAVLEQLVDQPRVAMALLAARSSPVNRVQPKLEEVTASHYPGLDLRAILGSDGDSEQ